MYSGRCEHIGRIIGALSGHSESDLDYYQPDPLEMMDRLANQ